MATKKNRYNKKRNTRKQKRGGSPIPKLSQKQYLDKMRDILIELNKYYDTQYLSHDEIEQVNMLENTKKALYYEYLNNAQGLKSNNPAELMSQPHIAHILLKSKRNKSLTEDEKSTLRAAVHAASTENVYDKNKADELLENLKTINDEINEIINTKNQYMKAKRRFHNAKYKSSTL